MNKINDLANRKKNASGEIIEAGQNSWKNYVLDSIPSKYARKHITRTCHIHDLEYYYLMYNCIGVSVYDLVKRKDGSFRSCINALHRAIVELTNIQSGGIGFINFDSDIAPYITNESDDEIIEIFHEFFFEP